MTSWLSRVHAGDGHGNWMWVADKELVEGQANRGGVLATHSKMLKCESPSQNGIYDRYELKLTKQVAPLVPVRADAIRSDNFITRLAENEYGKMCGVGDKKRALFTAHDCLRREEPARPAREAALRCGEAPRPSRVNIPDPPLSDVESTPLRHNS